MEKELVFPITVKHRGFKAKIYKRCSHTGKFRVTWYAEGKRRFRRCATVTEAKSIALAALREISRGQAAAAALSPKEMSELKLAQNALRALGVPILDAVSEYVAAKKLLPNAGLEIAAKAYRDNVTAVKRACISTISNEYLADRRGQIGSKTYYEEERRIIRICDALKLDLCDLSKASLEVFFDEDLKGLKGKTQNHFRQTFRQLFKFAVRRDYLSQEHRLGEVLINEPTNEASPEVLEPYELQMMLESASAEMIPYVAIAAFTGARRSEILRLSWENVWSIKGYIELEADKTKTRQRRLVPIGAALEKWLLPYRDCTGLVWKGGEGYFHSQIQKLMRDCGVSGQNILRHSYASYRLAQMSDSAKVASELGNSPQKLFTNYNKLRTPEQAEAWFAVVPQTEINIIQAYAS